MKTNLKPCPFCESTEVDVKVCVCKYWVECPKCEAEGPHTHSEVWAVRKWNRRGDECIWTHDEQYEKWDTSCGEAFCFIDGGPKKNKMKFCCYCGKELKEKKGKTC